MRRILRRLWIGVLIVLLVMVATVLSIPGVPGPGFVLYVAAFALVLGESRWLRKRYVLWKRHHPKLFKPFELWRRRRRERAGQVDSPVKPT